MPYCCMHGCLLCTMPSTLPPALPFPSYKILDITYFPAAGHHTPQQKWVATSCSCNTAVFKHTACSNYAIKQEAPSYPDSSTTMAQVCCRLRWCHTDLGANILSWSRLIQEDKRFSQLAPIACGLSAEHFDGVLAHHLVDSNWTIHHVTDSCLYDHSPSPQVCVLPQIQPCRLRRSCRC